MSSQGSKHIVGGLLLLFFGITLLVLSGFRAPIILGALLATLTFPLYNKIRSGLRDQKNLAALITLFIIVVGIIVPFIGTTALVGTEAFNIFLKTRDTVALDESLTEKFQAFSQKLNLDVNVENFIQDQVTPTIKSFSLFVYERTGSFLSGALNLVIDFVVMLFTIFYLLRDGEALGDFIFHLRIFHNNEGARLFKAFQNTGKAIIYGVFLTALAQGILGGLGFYFFGLGNPVLWGAAMGFFSLVPLLGPYAIYIPATFYMLTVSSPAATLGFFFYHFIIVSTIDNVIRPKIIANKINAHPLFIFLSVLGAIKFFGILGVVYGPLVAAILMVLLAEYRNPPLEAKTLESSA